MTVYLVLDLESPPTECILVGFCQQGDAISFASRMNADGGMAMVQEVDLE